MSKYILRRLMITIPILIGISIILFTLMNLAPGGPEAVLMGDDISAEAAARIRTNLGLDQPLPVQYMRWFSSTIRGDLGNSFRTGEPVLSALADRLPNTLILTLSAFMLSLIIAIPIGILSAAKQYSLIDKVATFVSFIGISFPSFWLGIVLILIFAFQFRLFPASGMATYGMEGDILNRLHHLVLPAFTLGAVRIATFMRFTRSGMLEVLSQDYIRTARAKGLGERVVIYKHAFRNALISITTVIGLTIPALIGGSVLTETIFAWPGLGRMAVNAVFQRDYPVIMGVNMVVAIVTVMANLGVDIIYTFIDPKITYN